ncbi:MAG: hypothetical protein JNK14_00435 [Chitinophagaceae bacterium]|nr:hypothetical protein [Chitinophagaceae bacterium]
MNKAFITLFACITCFSVQAQDTLPKFSVKNPGNNRIVIDWFNTFDDVKQISIQRSTDSLKNFKTILTVPDPALPQNGYADTKAPSANMFYRLYILLDKGVYLFSNARRPVWDTAIKREMIATEKLNLNLPVIPNGAINGPAVSGNNPVKTELWTPSRFVYTFKDGYIRITLPDDEKKYSIKFFTEDSKPLFELKDIKERSFKLDKANFYKSGWFKFELYEDGELKEKNKFFLPKEF